jgi:hypothetical protein
MDTIIFLNCIGSTITAFCGSDLPENYKEFRRSISACARYFTRFAQLAAVHRSNFSVPVIGITEAMEKQWSKSGSISFYIPIKL